MYFEMGVNNRVSVVAMARLRSGSRLSFLLIILMDLLGTAASNMEPIYWNSLNKRFLDDKGYVLYPQIGDRLDLICPSSDPPSQRAPAEYEFYKLYLVSSRDQADRCEVTGAPNLLLTCDKPNNDMRFTIKFQEYSPNLWGHEFKTNADYYIIGE
nr:ephrin-B3-like [Oncorhynchus nerka]